MDIKNSIDKFRALPKITFEQIGDVRAYQQYFLELYSQAFGEPVLPYMYTEMGLFDSYYRLRKIDEIKDLANIFEHGPPSPTNCTRIGRANFPNHPVFYCSQSPSLSIAEMKKWNGLGVKYALSKWKKRDSLVTFNHMPTFSSQPEYREHAINIVQKNVKGSKQEQENMLHFLLFLGDEFLSANGYSISASFAHQFLYTAKVDVISYPSVTDEPGINFAFSPRVIQTGLFKLDRVYTIEPQEGDKANIFQIGVFDDQNNPTVHNFHELDKSGEVYLTAKQDLFNDAPEL